MYNVHNYKSGCDIYILSKLVDGICTFALAIIIFSTYQNHCLSSIYTYNNTLLSYILQIYAFYIF